jgi:hypothetical protein
MSEVKWFDVGLDLQEISTFVDYLKLYKTSNLVTIKKIKDYYSIVYTCPFKLTENSRPYVGVPCW